MAPDDSRTWHFQDEPLDAAPAGFSFAKTGRGRPGRWVVTIDDDAPTRDHVLAQVDTDETSDRFDAVSVKPLDPSA
ncbi:MAG TPA: hypothetical protein VEM76_06515 [Anaeromyxobacteraceae bacterium]|nr:hypothetical protein [Anaeromyxobacteraceae bacterium]